MDDHSIYQRLHKEIELYAGTYPDGLTTTEIAGQLGITRQTAHTDLSRIEEMGYLIEAVEGRRYTIDPMRMPKISLPIAQTWFLYLPLRRMVRAQLHRYAFVNGLLHRLASSLNATIADQLLPDESEGDSHFDDMFTRLTKAWQANQLVEIKYKPLNETPRLHLVAPYWFEPAVWSDSIYLIAGLAQKEAFKPIVFKVDRILSVTPRLQTFTPLSPQEILEEIHKSWGVWGASDVTQVVLRFSARVQERLRESRWHPTEMLEEQPDGSVIWSAHIAEPAEMTSWIRAWGPDVEVLEPDSIRQQISLDIQLTAQLYGVCSSDEGYF